MPPQAVDVVVLHGPNLNLLGSREPEIYGRATLEEIDALIAKAARDEGLTAECLQSNHEGELVDALQALSYYADVHHDELQRIVDGVD